TGKPRPSNRVQVMIYMWAVPLALPRYKNVKFDGLLAYKDDEEFIPASNVSPEFVNRLLALIRRVGGPTECRKVPSFSECRFCNISAADCPDRIETEEPTTTELADF